MAKEPAFIDEIRQWFEPRLDAVIASRAGLEGAARYAMGWQDAEGRPSRDTGKRLRPVLTLAVAEAFGGTREQGFAGAAAIELVHNFSLVHDDVQDGDAERHGRPTVWRTWGAGQAINVGDYLVTTAFRVLAEADLPPERITLALGNMGRAVADMVQGQWTDLAHESWAEVTLDDYVAMVRGKTGALLGTSAALGAIAAGADSGATLAIERWAVLMGQAFQARDDYFGIWGDAGETGKPSSDIERRKKSLPLVLAASDPDLRQALVHAVTADGSPDVPAVLALLAGAGIDRRVEEQAMEWQREAETVLADIPMDDAQRARLARFGQFVVERTY